MRYYIIAGEPSGDLHGSNLIAALKEEDAEAQVRCWGGDRMREAGGDLVRHYKDQSFMGFLEVLKNLPAIFRNLSFCKEDIANFRPDALIFIDYSGFNLRIAKWAKKHGIPTHYYISPQIWASRENRIKAIRRDIDHMYVILPFEKEFYEEKHGYPVTFVGHPLLDAIGNYRKRENQDVHDTYGLKPELPVWVILPGSRRQEINFMLPVMLEVCDHLHGYQFVIGAAPSIGKEVYEELLGKRKIPLAYGATYELLSVAHAAMVTSGTATLETALWEVPQVVCYKGNWISYEIARRIIRLKYISLVNLILDRPVVKELIQGEFNTRNLLAEVERLTEPETRETMKAEYKILASLLGGPGASAKAAAAIIANIKNPASPQ